MESRLFLLVVSVSILLSGCVAAPQDLTSDDTPDVPSFRFLRPGLVDIEHRGFEPAITVGDDGTLYLCSPRGVPAGTNLYRSQDAGASWEHLGDRLPIFGGMPFRSGAGDIGGGDCDLTADTSGNIYMADLWIGGVSVLSSGDKGETWRGVPISAASPDNDRPFIAGGDVNEVFVLTTRTPEIAYDLFGLENAPTPGIFVARSTDGGLTFPQQSLVTTNEDRIGLNGNIAYADNTLFVAYTKKLAEGRLGVIVAVSHDRGLTWTEYVAAEQDLYEPYCFSPLDIFPIVTADDSGGVYASWAIENHTSGSTDVFFAASPDGGETWNEAVKLTREEGTRRYPWIDVSSDGRVGITWYETNVTLTQEVTYRAPGIVEECTMYYTQNDPVYYVHYAESPNPLDPEPTFMEALVMPEPGHIGDVGRPYGEIMNVKFDHEGRAIIAFVADYEGHEAVNLVAVQDRSSP